MLEKDIARLSPFPDKSGGIFMPCKHYEEMFEVNV
jgi:hypothetical protein